MRESIFCSISVKILSFCRFLHIVLCLNINSSIFLACEIYKETVLPLESGGPGKSAVDVQAGYITIGGDDVLRVAHTAILPDETVLSAVEPLWLALA